MCCFGNYESRFMIVVTARTLLSTEETETITLKSKLN
jgi:hypothetical protein